MREQENIHIKWLKSRVTFGIIVAGRVREGKDAAIYPYRPDSRDYSAFLSNDNLLFVFVFFLSAK